MPSGPIGCFIVIFNVLSACGGVVFSKRGPGIVPGFNICYRNSAIAILLDYFQAMLGNSNFTLDL
jgi:hypothetical protein